MKSLSNLVILLYVVFWLCFVYFWKLSFSKLFMEERVERGETTVGYQMWLSDYCLGTLGCIFLRNALCLHKQRSRGPSFLPSVALNRPTISYSPKYFQYLIESLFPSHFNFSFLDHYNTFYIITLYNHEQLPCVFCDAILMST